MLCNTTDITQYLKKNSINIQDVLQNRSSTMSFVSINYKIDAGQFIHLREYTQASAGVSAGVATITLDETFQISGKIRSGMTIRVDIGLSTQRKYIVDSINHTTKVLTLTTTLKAAILQGSKIGVLTFSGNTLKAPQTRRAFNNHEYTVSVSDYNKLFDRKAVVESYQNMYFREILSRIIYKFCANDTTLTLSDLESPTIVVGGNANTPTSDTADRIEGTNSIKRSYTGAGTGTTSIVFSSANISSYQFVRFFRKTKLEYGQYITAAKVRLGTDATNYYTYNLANFGKNYEDCRGLDSVEIGQRDSKTGTPDLTNITRFTLELTTSATLPADGIHLDIIQATTGGFTLQNVERGSQKYEDLRVQYKKPTVVIENLAKLVNSFRYIDSQRDFHFFSTLGDELAPIAVTDSSKTFSDLEISADITGLKNRQVVIGGDAVSEETSVQTEIMDGIKDTRTLDYKAKNLEIDTSPDGVTRTPHTVGVEGLVDPTTVEYTYSFQEKLVHRGTAPVLTVGTYFRMTYNPFRSIRVSLSDAASIASMALLTKGDGIYDGAVISDASIKTYQDARLRAKAELDAYKNPIININFKTNYDGLVAGQVVTVTNAQSGINANYLIQKVSATEKAPNYRIYSITASSTLFGLTEFFQLLLKRSERIITDVEEDIDVIVNIDETITLAEQRVRTKKSTTFRAASSDGMRMAFTVETGETSVSEYIGSRRNGFYATFGDSVLGTAKFETSDPHTNGKSLSLEMTTQGVGKIITARSERRKMNPSKQYRIRCQLKVGSLSSLGATPGATLKINRYTAMNTLTANGTATVFTQKSSEIDYTTFSTTFTSGASDNYFDIEFELLNATGKVRISELRIEELTTETSTNPAYADFSSAI